MEYTVNKLSKLSGVSTRTLRYYDEIGLLSPKRIASNGYRIYGQNEVDKLQQILFYRELNINLEDIKKIISSSNFEKEEALKEHLSELIKRKNQLEILIQNVTKTMKYYEGEIKMSDKEKFEGFKHNMIEENEQKYGKEIREKYGDDVVNSSNAKVKGMSEEKWNYAENLRQEINIKLEQAFNEGNPQSELAQEVCKLHKEWICIFWKDGMYSKEAHKGLGEMYVSDERFKKYYDEIDEGCAEFLRDSLNYYCR